MIPAPPLHHQIKMKDMKTASKSEKSLPFLSSLKDNKKRDLITDLMLYAGMFAALFTVLSAYSPI